MSYGMWRKEDLGKAGSMRDILLFTVLAKPHHRTIAPTLVRGNDSLGHSLLNSSHLLMESLSSRWLDAVPADVIALWSILLLGDSKVNPF